MTTRSWKRRMELVADRLTAESSPFIQWLRNETDRQCAAHLARIPADLRPAVAAALPDSDELSEWVTSPFAGWAVVPPDFEFPRSLVTWFLAPPRPWFLGHSCGTCGLNVPILMTWSNDRNPPEQVVVFPECPACGGRTGYMATFQPDDAVPA